jgi:hypothetical protein
MSQTFMHPTNGHTERVTAPRLWVLLFGFLYFLARGLPRPTIWLLLLALPTLGLAWVYAVVRAPAIVRGEYLRRGWTLKR